MFFSRAPLRTKERKGEFLSAWSSKLGPRNSHSPGIGQGCLYVTQHGDAIALCCKGGMNMGRFLNGVLVGVGIGLLVAPMNGKEMRRQVRESFQDLQSNLPDNEQLKQAGKQMAAGVSQTASQLKDYVLQATSQVKTTGNNLGDLAQQATSKVKQTGRDIANSTQAVTSMKQGEQTPTMTFDEEVEEPIIIVDDMALNEGR
jgi:gas vesicle protein